MAENVFVDRRAAVPQAGAPVVVSADELVPGVVGKPNNCGTSHIHVMSIWHKTRCSCASTVGES